MPKGFLPAALLVLTLITTAAAAESATPFEPMDVFELEWASNPQVSPDGRTIAYSRNGYDVMTDRPVSRIWLVASDGSRQRPLIDANGGGAVWSPDGGRIAFLSDEDGDPEIFMHWVADNRTASITRLTQKPSNLHFSPDGRWLAFSMFEPADEEPLVKPPKAPEGAEWAPAFKVYDDVVYRVDGQGYLKPGFTHVYVVPATGGSPRRITSGDFDHGAFAWSADGTAIIVSANRRPDWQLEPLDSDLYQVSVDTGAYTRLTERYGPDQEPAISPNGRYLAWTGFDDAHRGYENAELYVRDLVSGETRSLTADLDRSVSAPVWSDDSRAVYVQYEDAGQGIIARVARNGRIDRVAGNLGGTSVSRPYSGGDYDVSGDTIAYTRSEPGRPAELAVVRNRGVVDLTRLNEDLLAHRTLAEVRPVSFPSSLDGLDIQAWIATPPGFEPGGSYPLILEIHGGPFAAYGPHFAAEIQLYAAAGYVVIYANPRGSTSYGAAFANQIHHAYPGGDFDDLMSAVDFAIEQGYADEDRLYVTGGSGGGILTAWIVTHTNRFRAAVSAKPVINWYSFVLTGDMTNYFQRYWFARPPWEDPQSYLDRSPLSFVGNVETPTMMLTGEDDLRTPSSEAEQFYEALKLRGVDTMLVRVPEASHGIAARPSHLIGKVQHVLAWFERYPETP
ncbi:MAG: S9 family peptidase [Pseudomonadales bacterium]|jgi:acylaminoacyl-peptidase